MAYENACEKLLTSTQPSVMAANEAVAGIEEGTPRGVHPTALPPSLVGELLFIQRSLAVLGYRPHVQSLTLYDLVLSFPQLLPAVAAARQVIWDAVEAQFGLECRVWPETTSLISWTAGASISWHHDANRPYLAARHFSAVAYLGTQGCDFEGGTFCFQSGPEPRRVQPTAGMLLVYTADDSSVHCVEEVASGERCTLTMWFTLDPEHAEDKKVLSKLQSCQRAGLPITMYLADGLDIRVLRLQQRLGLTITVTYQPHPGVCQDDQQSGTTQQQASGQQTQPGQQQQQEQQQQEQYHVRCMAHSAAGGLGCKHTLPGGCRDLQEVVMVVCMAEWLAAASGSEGLACVSSKWLACCSSEAPASSALHCTDAALERASAASTVAAHGCHACMLLERLGAASQLLQVYLQDADCVLQQLLPQWVQLEALVPPSDVMPRQ